MTRSTTGRFFVPGPTEVRPEILLAMTAPMIPHRSAAFEELFATLQLGLRQLFGTTRTVILSTSSATGMMEGAVRSAPPGPILALVNGAFSRRFLDIALACGRDAHSLEAAPGAVVPLEAVEAALTARPYGAVLVVHSETSTGARSDVRAVHELARRHGAMALIDSVSGVGGIPLEFDAWDLDFVLTGSQKALALPPGLAFAVASERYLQTAAASPARGRYLDITELHDAARRNQTPATPALPLMHALAAQLTAIAEEGMPRRWARHDTMAAMTTRWVADPSHRDGVQLGILADAAYRAQTVSAVTVPEAIGAPAVVAALAARGYTLGEGYGTLRQRTFRIGHMGDHSPAALGTLFEVIDEALCGIVAGLPGTARLDFHA